MRGLVHCATAGTRPGRLGRFLVVTAISGNMELEFVDIMTKCEV